MHYRLIFDEEPIKLSEALNKKAVGTAARLGRFYHREYGEIDLSREKIEGMIRNFNAGVFGQKISVDLDHKIEGGAAGKIDDFWIEGSLLKTSFSLTDMGIEAINKKGYDYLSLEFVDNYQDNETLQNYGETIIGLGLTTRPFIKKQQPVKMLSDTGKEIITIKLSELGDNMQLPNNPPQKKDEKSAKTTQSHTETEPTSQTTTFTLSEVKQLIAEQTQAAIKEFKEKEVAAAKQLAEKLTSNQKLFDDTVAKELKEPDDAAQKLLAESRALITDLTTQEQITQFAKHTLSVIDQINASKKLAAMGYEPKGNVHIEVDESNEIKKLQDRYDQLLVRKLGKQAIEPRTEQNKVLAEAVLAQFDKANIRRLHEESKKLAGGETISTDIQKSPSFERNVIRDSLYNLTSINYVKSGTRPFTETWTAFFSERDTTAAGMNDTTVYERQPIPNSGITMSSEVAYTLPVKIGIDISNETMFLGMDSELDFDVLLENNLNASRIAREKLDTLINNEIIQSSNEYGTTAITNEDLEPGFNGTNTIFPLANFPLCHPRKIYDLRGNQVGSTLNPLVVNYDGGAIQEYDGTGTQAAGNYYIVHNWNLAEIKFCDETGAVFAPADTTVCTVSYTTTTNVVAWDTDLDAGGTTLLPEDRYLDLLYRIGVRKDILADDRLTNPDYALTKGTVFNALEQAKTFSANFARPGTNLNATGDLGQVKGLSFFRNTSPHSWMGDDVILIGQRGITQFNVMKPWTMTEMQERVDSNGKFIGAKHSYGYQYVGIYTPTKQKHYTTSIILYSSDGRVARVS